MLKTTSPWTTLHRKTTVTERLVLMDSPVLERLSDIFGRRPNSTVIDACKALECREGGCAPDPVTNTLMCVCIDNGQLIPPNPDNTCNNSPPEGSQIDPDKPLPTDRVVFPEFLFSSPGKTGQPSGAPSTSSDPSSFNLLYVIIPFVTFLVATLFVVLVITLCIRRRRKRNNKQTPAPKVTWLCKQDRVNLLDTLTVVSENPLYRPVDTTETIRSLYGATVNIIPEPDVWTLNEIGEGAFGKVFRGEYRRADGSIEQIAVKTLKEEASEEIQDDFRREVKTMGSFNHKNILSLIGIIIKGPSQPLMVFEYMQLGDLANLLRSNDPFSGHQICGRRVELNEKQLMVISAQIANGMVYLSSRHFVHRDLATRNCLVASDLTIKISDFGMSRDIYSCDYYKVIGGSKMLPVRWMAPESIMYGIFTSESDVWSFGVVLWEIYSFGKQPHFGHSNEEVIRFIVEDHILLSPPSTCPAEVNSIMFHCWVSDPRNRYTFQQILDVLADLEHAASSSSDNSSGAVSYRTNSSRTSLVHGTHSEPT